MNRMRALTLYQPWAWIVAHGHKPLENRPWAPPGWFLGEIFAIHAGRHYDAKSEGFIYERLGWVPPPAAREVLGAVIGLAKVVRVVTKDGQGSFFDSEASLLPDEKKWFVGPLGWVLRDVVALSEPIVCKGNRMLWFLPPEVQEQLHPARVQAAAGVDVSK